MNEIGSRDSIITINVSDDNDLNLSEDEELHDNLAKHKGVGKFIRVEALAKSKNV